MLKGQKVDLRPISDDDTENIVRWRNNPIVQRNFIFREKLTHEMHTRWLRSMVDTKKAVQLIIVDKESGKDVGSAYLRDIDYIHKKAEFGIFIGEDDARGKGFGTEAIKLMVQYGFEVLLLHKIFLRVFAENINAIKCYEKCGFKVEGLFKDDIRIDNEYFDMVFMAILNEN